MTDAHCHPFDLIEFMPGLENEIEKSGLSCAASSWNRKEFDFNRKLAKKAAESGTGVHGMPKIIPCFGIHPQLPADKKLFCDIKDDLFSLLELLAAGGRLGAIGETGFDLYNENFRETEKMQEELFVFHLENAVKHDLPVVIHARRAMHKIFPFTKTLKKLPAVIFHSWPGTAADGEALIRRGINVFFSFGNAVVNNHREAMRCAAVFPAERLLLETDAPYQPLKGKAFSSFDDLSVICHATAAMRKEAGLRGGTPEELEELTDSNFYMAFKKKSAG